MGKRVHSTQYELIQHQPAVADSEREAGPLPVDWVHFYNQVNIWHKNALFSHKTFKKLAWEGQSPLPRLHAPRGINTMSRRLRRLPPPVLYQIPDSPLPDSGLTYVFHARIA